MNRPYAGYPESRRPAYSRNVDGVGGRGSKSADSTETVVIEDYDEFEDRYGDGELDGETDTFDDGYDDTYDDGFGYYEEPIDRRWIWVGGIAAAVLLVAVICTVVILGGGDSGSVSATVSPPAVTTTQAAPKPLPPPPPVAKPSLPAPAPLAPETVSTVAPTPTAVETPAPTVAAPDPRTITYQVSGTRQLLDMVTVIYTDQQGALQTAVNVALPWSKTVVLDPGVQLTSVTATSLMGNLNCSITDASGALINASATNSMIATCTK